MVLRTEIEKNGDDVEVVNPPTVRTSNLREKEGVCVDGFRIHHNPKENRYYVKYFLIAICRAFILSRFFKFNGYFRYRSTCLSRNF